MHRTDKQLRLTSILPATTICRLSSSNRPLIDHHVWLTSREKVRSCVAGVYRGREDVNSGARGGEGRARRVSREHELKASLQALTISPSSRARVPPSPSPINACHTQARKGAKNLRPLPSVGKFAPGNGLMYKMWKNMFRVVTFQLL